MSNEAKILIVDDDPGIRTMLNFSLEQAGYEVEFSTDGEAALERLKGDFPFDLVLLDVMLPNLSGDQLLKEIKAERPDVPVIMLTAHPSVKLGVECIKKGAFDFIAKPFDLEQLLQISANAIELSRLRKENKTLRQTLQSPSSFSELIGSSMKMQDVKDSIRKASSSRATVLLQGKSGTGKEVAAKCIHSNSELYQGPFVAVNCGAIPENLVESELFGFEKGSFTGADHQQRGKFEQAQNGTIFLDEVGELPLSAQVKLLRVLQEKEVQRLGSGQSIPLNIRIIAASNRDLQQLVSQGKFREDLYYRLAIWVIEMPDLHQRGSDIVLLAKHFLAKFAELEQKPDLQFSPKAERFLLSKTWPGNVRQLENCIYRTVVAAQDKSILEERDIELLSTKSMEGKGEPRIFAEGVIPMQDVEHLAVVEALEIYGGNVQKTAEALAVSRITLYRKLKNWGINPQEVRKK